MAHRVEDIHKWSLLGEGNGDWALIFLFTDTRRRRRDVTHPSYMYIIPLSCSSGGFLSSQQLTIWHSTVTDNAFSVSSMAANLTMFALPFSHIHASVYESFDV